MPTPRLVYQCALRVGYYERHLKSTLSRLTFTSLEKALRNAEALSLESPNRDDLSSHLLVRPASYRSQAAVSIPTAHLVRQLQARLGGEIADKDRLHQLLLSRLSTKAAAGYVLEAGIRDSE